jgi:hypothetical protein
MTTEPEVEQTEESSPKNQQFLLLVAVVLFLGLGVWGMLQDKNTLPSSGGTEATVFLGTKDSASNRDSLETPLDMSAMTPEIYNRIIEKIKSTPNDAIKASIDSGVSMTTFYYSISPDPLVPGSTNAFVLEIESETYLDEEGQQYPDGPVYDLIQMRDSDFDTFPNDYWTSDFGEDLTFKPLTETTPQITQYVTMWNVGIAYFKTYLLEKEF